MTTFTWSVQTMDRYTSDNFVFVVHYNVTAVDGDYTASTYGTTSYTQQAGETYIPYEDLKPEIVIGWVQTSLGKDVVESSLQAKIELLKNPIQESGLPW